MSKDLIETFLSLVRLGINHQSSIGSADFDWADIENLAARQGLSAILVDGIERLPEKQRPPKPLLLQWIGETLQGYEYRYELYCRTIAEMAQLYNTHGYKMMILKGFACGLNWPKPEHRPCGDIDIWQFGKQKEADIVLQQEKGIKIDTSEHQHTVFYWRNFMVENHYDFVNIFAHSSSKEMESIFKDLGTDDSYFVELYGEKVYLPSPNLHALFLIRHMLSHFAAAKITLRQVLDWAFFVEKHTKVIDWDWLTALLKRYYMMDFFNSINAICIENLGFSSSIFTSVQFLPALKEKVLYDILYPNYVVMPKSLLKRVFWKIRRWKNNDWKRKLCFNESDFSSLWGGVKSHLLKPKTI